MSGLQGRAWQTASWKWNYSIQKGIVLNIGRTLLNNVRFASKIGSHDYLHDAPLISNDPLIILLYIHLYMHNAHEMRKAQIIFCRLRN